MGLYVIRRLAWTLVVIWAIVTIAFGATFLSPIDPARAYAGQFASAQTVAALRHSFGLDRPVWVQYERYLRRLASGDLGTSLTTGEPVTRSVWERLPATLLLALVGGLGQLALGVPLGVAAALNKDTWIDRLVLVGSLAGSIMPPFILGFVLLYLLAFKLAWFPLGGSSALGLVLPALTLAVSGAAWYARLVRSNVLNILGEDYVRLARAKGLPERIVIWRHVMRSSLGPVIILFGANMGVLIGGALVIERVFAWPGIGSQAWQAITFNDVPMILGTVIVAAVGVTLANLAADLMVAVVDPRVEYR